jgi:hypothetical protein
MPCGIAPAAWQADWRRDIGKDKPADVVLGKASPASGRQLGGGGK